MNKEHEGNLALFKEKKLEKNDENVRKALLEALYMAGEQSLTPVSREHPLCRKYLEYMSLHSELSDYERESVNRILNE